MDKYSYTPRCDKNEALDRSRQMREIVEESDLPACGINPEAVEEIVAEASAVNENGFLLIEEFLTEEAAHTIAHNHSSGTINEVDANMPYTKELINFMHKTLVITSKHGFSGSPDVFITKKDGITSHRDEDTVNTGLVLLDSGEKGLQYYLGEEADIPLSENTQIIPREKSKLDYDDVNELEHSKIEPQTVTVKRGGLLVLGAHALECARGSFSITHAAHSKDKHRVSLGVYKK